ncbi:maltose-binding protein MalE [Paenibacillus brasilensis]|uniref:Maltose-binding protein MalE n=1 Tax=Paenibacillus brasilensis TaxID=128574 RepID=A0ABU0KXC6_9BACL|nr:extracellular solute-binding protein [Paenibacillus brasilensis]MDQ0494089.1 maltose-binding protein MalE [Paenibacillus brasilensis]
MLLTRVVKTDVPDIVGLGATDTYSILAQSGIFTDLANTKLPSTVDPIYLKMLKDVTGIDPVYGIPYAANANGVMYNKTLFKEMGLHVPKTWDELIATAKKIRLLVKFHFILHIRMIDKRTFPLMHSGRIWWALIFSCNDVKTRSPFRKSTARLHRSSWSC